MFSARPATPPFSLSWLGRFVLPRVGCTPLLRYPPSPFFLGRKFFSGARSVRPGGGLVMLSGFVGSWAWSIIFFAIPPFCGLSFLQTPLLSGYGRRGRPLALCLPPPGFLFSASSHLVRFLFFFSNPQAPKVPWPRLRSCSTNFTRFGPPPSGVEYCTSRSVFLGCLPRNVVLH